VRRSIILLLALILIALPQQITNAASPTPGATCSKVGLTQIHNAKKYTCVKSGKRLVWSKGFSVIKPSATPSPTPSNSPSASPRAAKAPIGAINGVCPKVNPEADALRTLAKREILNSSLPSFISLEIEPGALDSTQIDMYKLAISAAVRASDQTSPIKYFIPKTKKWFLERWPNEDVQYLNQILTYAPEPFPAHSWGRNPRYAVVGVVDKPLLSVQVIQSVSIILKPLNLRGADFHWYGHSFGGPYGAAVTEALGISCYSAYRKEVIRMAKEMGPDLTKNIDWNVPSSGWYQGFLANEYLTGKLGIAAAGNLIPDSSNISAIDEAFKKSLDMDLKGFYEFMAKKLAIEFS
jgi:hypothetical protein